MTNGLEAKRRSGLRPRPAARGQRPGAAGGVALRQELERFPGDIDASARLAHLALQRGDAARAVPAAPGCRAGAPGEHSQLPSILPSRSPTRGESLRRSRRSRSALEHTPVIPPPGSCWGSCGRRQGDADGALKAAYQAVTRAQRAGQWKDAADDPATSSRCRRALRSSRCASAAASCSSARSTICAGKHGRFGAGASRPRALRLSSRLGLDARPTSGSGRSSSSFPTCRTPRTTIPTCNPGRGSLRAAFPQIRAEAIARAGGGSAPAELRSRHGPGRGLRRRRRAGAVVGSLLLLPARRALRRQPSALPRHQRGAGVDRAVPDRRAGARDPVLGPQARLAHQRAPRRDQRAPGHAPAARRAAAIAR